MKTPRDILLERHRAAETKLDAIRENAVADHVATPAECGRPRPQQAAAVLTRAKIAAPLRLLRGCAQGWAHSGFALTIWRELVLPCRRIWVGVAAVWLVIIALHLATGAPPKPAAGQLAVSGQDVMMALREQKEILAELTAPVAPSPVSPPPAARPAVPGPRGDLQPATRSA